MGAGDLPDHDDEMSGSHRDTSQRYNVIVTLNHEQMAAAEGWRAAHGIESRAEALGELVRLGLLGEVAKIYRLIGGSRAPAPSAGGKSRS
jgi:hypothetical protein